MAATRSIAISNQRVDICVTPSLPPFRGATSDRALMGGEAAPSASPGVLLTGGHDDAEALFEAQSPRHQPWLPSHRGRRTLCRRPGRAADFLARWMASLAPQAHRHRHVPGACPDGADAPSPDAKCRVCFFTPLLLRRMPINKILPSGSRGQGRRASVVFLRGVQAPVSGRDAICPNALPAVQSLAPPATWGTVPPRLRLGRLPLCSGGAKPDRTRRCPAPGLITHLVALASVRRNPDHPAPRRVAGLPFSAILFRFRALAARYAGWRSQNPRVPFQ